MSVRWLGFSQKPSDETGVTAPLASIKGVSGQIYALIALTLKCPVRRNPCKVCW